MRSACSLLMPGFGGIGVFGMPPMIVAASSSFVNGRRNTPRPKSMPAIRLPSGPWQFAHELSNTRLPSSNVECRCVLRARAGAQAHGDDGRCTEQCPASHWCAPRPPKTVAFRSYRAGDRRAGVTEIRAASHGRLNAVRVSSGQCTRGASRGNADAGHPLRAGVEPCDTLVFVTVPAVLALIAAAAVLIPAHRASRGDQRKCVAKK